MENGKVLSLYVTMPDFMRSGHRMRVDDFDCDPSGVVGSRDYDSDIERSMVLVSKTSYDIIEEAGLVLEQGVLMEDIYVDVDLYDLKQGSIIEIGETIFKVLGACEDYRYLYAFAPELPELLEGKRGLFVSPIEYGSVEVGNSVNVLEKA